MLYRYYRYILLLKILLLVSWLYILLQNRNNREIILQGTTILVTSWWDQGKTTETLPKQLAKSPLPWSLIVQNTNTGYALHIPRTEDSGFVADYLTYPLPHLASVEQAALYRNSCRSRLVLDAVGIQKQSCQPPIPYDSWLAIILIILGVII